ncbi:MAG: 16S rRNA (guanine(527)-N(7))-methyltransferase RsmG [Anaerostipes sp.]|nr:16S rRNA (guanine(527)-N(7))-methyltransferase RsmG [Anaerostipes sp.]MDD3746511.1 16S rRNA (guanine(527)-N(7))-methyltransferase RsmG [Anaerostipes sp.]
MDKLKEKALEMGIELTDNQLKQFETYFHMIIEKNKVMNLTAITEKDEVIDKHFVDSLAFVKSNIKFENQRILDIGTGAGFPGIPLKIAFPDLEVVLLDSLNKRITFLNEVIDELGLKNITAIHGRAEDYAKQKEYREGFDIVVSRAVANMSTLSEYCIPYVKLNGYFMPYKSGNIEKELNQAKKAIKILGGKIQDKILFTLPETDMERSLIEIKKEKTTPKRFPRKAGLPSKEPI